ncbi:PLP-dependent transferase [Dentipellis sp. KUC8613]|nr:PLP-dependent transferase [Dentipellis sp. KUC8613]
MSFILLRQLLCAHEFLLAFGLGYLPNCPDMWVYLLWDLSTPVAARPTRQYPTRASTSSYNSRSTNELELVFSQQTAPKDAATIIIEPVIGEGGSVPAAPRTFSSGLRKTCAERDILLIVDKVQSGYGRTGKNFGIERSGLRPDIVTGPKACKRFPLNTIKSKEAHGQAQARTHASSAISCTAAVAVADAFEAGKILDNVQAHGALRLAHALKQDPLLAPHILDGGHRVCVAVALGVRPRRQLAGSPRGFAGRVAKRCLTKGVLILTTSVYETIRFFGSSRR